MRFKMNFKPLHDRIAVLPVPGEEKTIGGIIIPDTAKEKPMQGKVVAVGNGLRDKDGKLVPLEVKVGDIVMYGKWGGTEVKIDGKDIVIMKESDVMGIVIK
jgi:chaperonin GroES